MPAKKQTPPPAYFLSLSLENVRSFGEKQTISFARPDGRPAQWTIILGDNGVGKTTVLKSLASIMVVQDEHDENSLVPAYVQTQRNWLLIRSGKQALTRLGEDILEDFYKITPLAERLKNLELTHSVVHSEVIASKRLVEFRQPNTHVNKKIYLTLAQNHSRDGTLGRGWRNLDGNIVSNLYAYGYGAGRTVGNSTIGETPTDADTCASLFDDRADLLDPQEWFLNVDYGSKLAGGQGQQLADARDRVEKMLIQVLPGVTELQIVATGTPQKPQISLQFLLFGTWVRLRDMSLGYQTLVVWLTDFASKLYVRYPESENPLAEPAIVLIDEIDLHLHPRWQRELLDSLSKTFPNTQFIATAHSPLVVQAAGDAGANVVLLKREGDQTVVQQNLEDVRGWRLDQILTSELFGLETARSLETERKLERRAALLTKTRRTAAEKKELEKLTEELDAEPLGETPSEREVNAVLQELRQRLLKKSPDNQAA